MPAVKKAKVAVAIPTTPQEAADLARNYRLIDEQRADIQKLRDAQRDALIKYVHENHLEDDPQAIPFEDGNDFLCAVLKVVPRSSYDIRYAPNDLILWAAAQGILTVSATALEPQKLTAEYAAMQAFKQPAGGAESIEFVSVEA